jgi:hypothetical protein
MRGASDLVAATYAFKYFDQYTAWFPIRIEASCTPGGTWSVDMLASPTPNLPLNTRRTDLPQLANNNSDPGMRINTLMFALGRARLEFDRQDGLC